MSKAAFDALYREHYYQIRAQCRRMLGSEFDAEDATQEVFMRGYRAFGRYKARDPFGPWIGTIATNYCIDVLRRRQRLKDVFAEVSDDVADPPDPSEDGLGTLISSHDAQAITQAVEALPEGYRLPIVLAYYSDASYDEIAKTLGVTANHVGVLLLRGKQRLRRDLAERHEELT